MSSDSLLDTLLSRGRTDHAIFSGIKNLELTATWWQPRTLTYAWIDGLANLFNITSTRDEPICSYDRWSSIVWQLVLENPMLWKVNPSDQTSFGIYEFITRSMKCPSCRQEIDLIQDQRKYFWKHRLIGHLALFWVSCEIWICDTACSRFENAILWRTSESRAVL